MCYHVRTNYDWSICAQWLNCKRFDYCVLHWRVSFPNYGGFVCAHDSSFLSAEALRIAICFRFKNYLKCKIQNVLCTLHVKCVYFSSLFANRREYAAKVSANKTRENWTQQQQQQNEFLFFSLILQWSNFYLIFFLPFCIVHGPK